MTIEERVLVIGDSHLTSTFGKALDLLLRTRVNAQITTIGSCGVSPSAFLHGTTSKCGTLMIKQTEPDWTVVARKSTDTPRIEKLLRDLRPTMTIVELGANQLHTAYKDPMAAAVDARLLAESIVSSGSECMWIGPPAGRDAQKPQHKMHFLYWVLEEAVSDLCTFTDSRPSELAFLDYERIASARKKKGDGRHFDAIGVVGQEMARRWALTVFETIDARLDQREREEHEAHSECTELRPSALERMQKRQLARR